MQTVILEQPGRLALAETAAPDRPPPGHALVRVRRIGVCGTDSHAYRGEQPFFTYPRILGHELGVEVVALGPAESEAGASARRLAVGGRCAVEPYLACGACIACRRGKTNCCVQLRVLGVHVDGGMREYLTVPVANLHPSAALSLEQLALVEPLTIGAHAVARAQLVAGEHVAVLGAGPIGLAVGLAAHAAGARLLVLDLDEHRLAFCRRQIPGVETLVAPVDPLPALEAFGGGDLPTAVFDATGSARSMAAAFRYVAHGGRLILVGLVQGAIAFDDPDFHRRELTVLASRNAMGADFARTLRLLEEGAIDTAPWVTHRAAQADVAEQFPRWLEPGAGVIKAVVTVAG